MKFSFCVHIVHWLLQIIELIMGCQFERSSMDIGAGQFESSSMDIGASQCERSSMDKGLANSSLAQWI